MDYTYAELKKTVDDSWETMSEDEQHRWYQDPSPTLEMYVLSQMKEGDSVYIDYDNNTYEIIK